MCFCLEEFPLNFLLAEHFAEGCVTVGALKQPYFQLHSFSLFVWAPCHFPTLLRFRTLGSAFGTFSHDLFFSVMLRLPWFRTMVDK